MAALEKPFLPPCTLKHKDAHSALKRVKSESCKRLIYKTACLSEAKMLFNLDLKRTCPVPRDKGSPAKPVDPTRTGYGNPIRIAFVLTLHGRAFRQVKRLFKALYHNNHYFFFHIDSVSTIKIDNFLLLVTLTDASWILCWVERLALWDQSKVPCPKTQHIDPSHWFEPRLLNLEAVLSIRFM